MALTVEEARIAAARARDYPVGYGSRWGAFPDEMDRDINQTGKVMADYLGSHPDAVQYG